MEKIIISILTENAAFEDQRELPRILHNLADHLEVGHQPEVLLDINGNKVGIVEYE